MSRKFENLQTKYQNGMKMIKEEERLMDDKLRCIVCLRNQKNVVIEGCMHLIYVMNVNKNLKQSLSSMSNGIYKFLNCV